MTPHTPVDTLRALVAKWREVAAGERRYDATLDSCANELEAALASLPVEGWRTMDSAPMDGSSFIAWLADEGFPTIVRWDTREDAWQFMCFDLWQEGLDDMHVMTHWKRWPDGPAAPQDQRQGNEQGGTHE